MADLLTTEQIAERYHLASTDAAADWMNRKLPCFKVGKRLFVWADDVIEWERKNKVYPVLRRAKWK